MLTSLRGRAQQHHFTAALYVRLAATARRLVEQRYAWDAIGRRFTALVEEAVARRVAPCQATDPGVE